MSSTSESETEILLGNKHLLAIFFVLAVLLGIAFTGGYMVGRNSFDKKPAALSASVADPTASTTAAVETHSLPPAGAEQSDPPPASSSPTDQTRTVLPPPPVDVPSSAPKEESPLGTRKPEAPAEETPQPKSAVKQPAHAKAGAAFAGPQSGQTFLQVAAVGHTEAKALADVLGKKGFEAHAVAKPGGGDVYRVLIGPMSDNSQLSATRDSLRNAGFTKIFVQRY
jgi:cell division septation protein DedD